MLSAALRRGPHGKELREPLAHSQEGIEAFNPTATETDWVVFKALSFGVTGYTIDN